MNKLTAIALLALAAACGAPQSPAPETPSAAANLPAGLEIRDAWAAPTPGGVDVSAGYFTIANGGPADRLLSIASPRAGRIEIHEMSMEGSVMRMRKVEGGLAIPAGAIVTLGPGGYHLMFNEVAPPFAAGEQIPVTLTFENAGVREVSLPVRADALGH